MTNQPQPPDLPALFRSSDAASRNTQRCHFALIGVQLGALFLAALASAIQVTNEIARQVLAASQILFMFSALVTGFIAKASRYDDRWFDHRAMAEAVRRATWKWIMRDHSAPVPAGRGGTHAEDFIQTLREIRERMSGKPGDRAAVGTEGQEITPWMRNFCSLPLRDKVATYTKDRVEDQVRWYAAKATANSRKESVWRWGTIGVESFATLLAVFMLLWAWPIAVVALLSALAAAWIAWGQAKRYSDLATSYQIASEDLGLLKGLSPDGEKANYPDLYKWVDQVEAAISREHRVWFSRSGVQGGGDGA